MTEHITVSRELLRQVRDLLTFMQEWVDAVPADARLPAMPGFDGDWAAGVKADLRAALEQPPQKPELRVGQIWRTRGGCMAKIEAEMKNLPYPFRCASGDDQWTVTEAGRYYYRNIESRADLIELISDVHEGGEA